MTSTITKTVFFAADKKTVWAFLTEKEKLKEWFQPAEADLAEGSDYALIRPTDDGGTQRICWGTVTHWNLHEKLAYTFTLAPLDGHITNVEWTLEDAGSGTRLTLVHTGLPVEGEAFNLLLHLDAGWDKHIAALRENISA